MKSGVILVTTTFSPSLTDMRAQLALKTCHAARALGYNMIVVDGSPSLEFKAALRETGVTVFDETVRGMGSSRRQTLKAGLDTDAEVVVWLEPEKYPIVPLLYPCVEHVLSRNFDVVIPRRRSLDSYPAYQAFSELRANWELGNILDRHDLDYYIGPRIMNRDAAAIMARYDGKIDGKQTYGDNWEILFIPLIEMLQLDMWLGSVIVDYIHPKEQLVEDDETMRAKRDKQRNDLVSAMSKEASRVGLLT